MTQDKMKQIANRYEVDKQFQVGDLAYLQLHSYIQGFVASKSK